MKIRKISVFVCVIAVAMSTLPGVAFSSGEHHRHRPLPRSRPEAQGVSSKAILEFINAAEKNNFGLHSFMIIRHGYVVSEGWWSPYTPELKHMMFSASKSFTSTAVGLAVAEGRLRLDDKVASFFPNDVPAEISDNLAAMQVRHLLTMSTGQEQDLESIVDPSVFDATLLGAPTIKCEENWPKQFLSIPVKHPPGSQFFYSSGASYMLSAIVQKATGQTMLQYLQQRLFEPLGIEGAEWESDPRGVNTGGWGLRLKTEDLARFGLLYLQNGIWNNKRVLPVEWIREAMSPQIRTVASPAPIPATKDDAQNWYGYQFWQNIPGGFRADGAFGQLSIVLPNQDAVVAITAEFYDSQRIVNLVWSHLLPGIAKTRLAPDKVNFKQLARKIASLTLLPQKGFSTSPVALRISGQTFRLNDNPLKTASITFTFGNSFCDFVLSDGRGDHHIRCGLNNWVKGTTTMPGMPPRFLVTSPKEGSTPRVAASGTWSNANTFVMTWQFIETPHSITVRCHFDGDKVRLELVSSLSDFFRGAPSFKGQSIVMEGQLRPPGS